jgi:uncharacterized membrane protein (UPF0182 family)
MTTRRWLILALAAAAVLLIAGRAFAGLYADYLWYDSLGAVALWGARLEAVATLRIASTAAAALFAFANLYAVRQSVVTLVLPRRLGNLEIGEEVPGRYLTVTAVVLSVILGVLLALPQQDWTTFELARFGRPFGETDPYHSKDLGFFVYWLPFESSLWTWAFFSILIIAVAVIALYALTPSLKWQRSSLYASTYVRRHFTVIIGVLLLMLAWSFRLDMYGLLLDGTGPDGAFGYVDYRVGIPGDLMLSLATLGAALIVIWAGFAGQFRLAGVSVITTVALSLIVREVVPAIVRHSGTDAERAARERPFLATRATYTRRAFAVEALPHADSTITYPSLVAALPWVPIWDPPALARAIDGGRAGDLASVRIGWHATNVGLVGDVVDPPPPGAAARAPWTLARIIGASADERGAPLRVAGPSASAIDDVPLEAPLVYPGATTYVVISDSLSLNTGTSLENGLARVAYAWALQNFRLLSNDGAQPRPKIVVHRDVSERIRLLAPFFVQGSRIEPLLVGDSLYWGVDLYTASNTYPLSNRFTILGEERSYLRHAAVAVVDASTGEISVVPDSVPDRVAVTWKEFVQSVFGTWNTLPPEIPSLLPPPIDGLSAQALAFGRYGTRLEPGPQRHIPILDGADTSLITDPLPMVLPGARTTSLALPLVDENDRLRGLFIGTGGTARTTMWYSLSAAGPGWSAILSRLRSLDSAGTAAREGPLVTGRVRSVPVHSGIAFLQPRYRWRPPNTPPALYRVALLDDSAKLLAPNVTAPSRPTEAPATPGDLRASIAALYSTMREALKRGDWVAFGRAFDALGRAIGAASPR